MMIKMGQDEKYRTRKGEKVRILAVDLGGGPPVAVATDDILFRVGIHGKHMYSGQHDIIEVPPTIRVGGWVNVHANGAICRIADPCGMCVARLYIDSEVTEGEGF
jgi:hypothetical protein